MHHWGMSKSDRDLLTHLLHQFVAADLLLSLGACSSDYFPEQEEIDQMTAQIRVCKSEKLSSAVCSDIKPDWQVLTQQIRVCFYHVA